jgi:hypothetical protein
LPGVETLTNYAFKFGRLQLLDMPLTINPTGCARSEPKLLTHFRKSHAIAACNSSNKRSKSSGSINFFWTKSTIFQTDLFCGCIKNSFWKFFNLKHTNFDCVEKFKEFKKIQKMIPKI